MVREYYARLDVHIGAGEDECRGFRFIENVYIRHLALMSAEVLSANILWVKKGGKFGAIAIAVRCSHALWRAAGVIWNITTWCAGQLRS